MPDHHPPNEQPSDSAVPQPIEPETPVNKPLPKNNLPDWKPLGTIRDYFTEQMKQDGFYGR